MLFTDLATLCTLLLTLMHQSKCLASKMLIIQPNLD